MADEIREKSEAQIWWESDLNLYNACNWIEENYATPEECFSIFAQQGRRDYNSFIVAVGQGHDRATLVWYRLNTAFDKWMVESRKKVLDSDDQIAKTILRLTQIWITIEIVLYTLNSAQFVLSRLIKL